jgi:hypothetical protein
VTSTKLTCSRCGFTEEKESTDRDTLNRDFATSAVLKPAYGAPYRGTVEGWCEVTITRYGSPVPHIYQQNVVCFSCAEDIRELTDWYIKGE